MGYSASNSPQPPAPGTFELVQVASGFSNPLDVTGRSGFTSGGETGLLGLAFHPNYANNGHFYVNYTRNNGSQLQTVVAEFTASAGDANFADPTSENILFTVDQPSPIHKGGSLAFGKDGFLYIGLGDGGPEDDPLGVARIHQVGQP
ncbi:MAG TPA: PQQ-dependent sugar dehydrogenase [Candidatus Dormibacteraeota bacterium]|nr:PQQ-dependent sugar dehydrogenase [Candidatus Dormibacteraeota bacterium]